MAKPIVAIVGRPNVGKSALFNRLIGERVAIVEDEPGTTRDRVYGTTDWRGIEFTLVDTGGLQDEAEIAASHVAEIAHSTREQARSAISEADVIVFMVDAKTGATSGDYEVADLLRRTDKPTILGANKADNLERRDSVYEFYELGLGEPIAISALHGTGTGDLLDAIVEALPHFDEEEIFEGPQIAIVGRPNVGKSRLVNALLGQERAIVSDIPGTTRDSLDTHLEWNGTPVTLIDTAGIRRRGRVETGIEQYSVLRSMRAIDRSDVVLMVVDATEPFTAQDLHIAGYVEEQKKGIVIVVNKWDLIEKDTHTMDDYRAEAAKELVFVPYAPITFISAKYGQRVQQVLDLALDVVKERKKRIPTAALNKMLREAVANHPPSSKSGKPVKFFYGTQVDIEPPTFVFFCSDPKQLHFSYRRYLENQLRSQFAFTGTPIRISFRGREDAEI
ncbi:MAG: ribosome biogenesis GTPase Der [Thermomicrobiales bacterium]|nr:ribosome biogenesis GTPase Der [Thermomicrobiales bacterium]